MLQHLMLFNFQSHRKTEFEFSSGVNVITGTSDAGKSTAIRGVEWIVNNRPPGDAIKNWNSQERDKTAAEIRLDEQAIVTKERVKGKSKYIIHDIPTEDEETFEAIKQDVPDSVADLINFNECNIQTQHQPYFFLNDTAGEVARKLNELVGLDIIDTMYKNLDSRIRSVAAAVRSTSSVITNLKEEIDNLAYVDDLHKRVIELEEAVDVNNDLANEIFTLSEMIEAIASTESVIDEIKEQCPFGAEEHVKDLLDKIDELEDKKKEFLTINAICDSLDKIIDDLQAEKDWLECEPLYNELIKLIEDQEDTAREHIELERSIKKMIVDTKAFEYETKQVGILFTEYIDKLRQAKMCPLCKSKITEATITTIERSL